MADQPKPDRPMNWEAVAGVLKSEAIDALNRSKTSTAGSTAQNLLRLKFEILDSLAKAIRFGATGRE